MPAAMVHGGGGVLLIMTTKFASQETSKRHKVTKQMQSKPPPSQPYPSQNNNTKSQAKTTIATNTLLHQSNLLQRCNSLKRERWTKDDNSAMQPALPMELSAMCEGRGAH